MQDRVVIVLDAAVDDLETGRAFYDSREQNVGRYFLDCLLADLESLKLYAGIHPIHFTFYRALSQRFPYAIYYDVTDGIVRVAAILDMRRDPLWLRKELTSRPHH